ncbi:manganese transporter [Niveispirillum lacus]|uniref:Manganese transporter n=1 Tax=Niveispirillum lacus TaxID=1981099 RepID=A0A255YT13_9PROT|nr:iron chelate uptake ABC transporter family permease subunit [Niveispirillum lacus]OYQ32362.1 manganese transporter [Niveispirillum lacus]
MEMVGHNTLVVLLGATALGLAAGMVGCFMVLRRRALVSDALSHATLPGIVTAFLTGLALGIDGRSLPLLLAGAAISGVIAVLTIQAIKRWTRLTEDAAIGAVLSVFFGAGVVLLSVVQELPAANAAGLKGFIFGQTAAMRSGEAMGLGALALVAAALIWLFFKEFRLLAFDEGFARAAGWPTGRIDLALMALVTLVTVVGLQTVGLVLIIALLITPAATARFWTDDLAAMLIIAGGVGAVSGGVGALLSSRFADLPAGAIIVLVATSLFFISLIIAPSRGLLGRSLRRARLRRALLARGITG